MSGKLVMWILMIFAVAIIMLFDGIPLIKKKQWRELMTFAVILATACFLFVGGKMGLKPPLKILSALFDELGKSLFG